MEICFAMNFGIFHMQLVTACNVKIDISASNLQQAKKKKQQKHKAIIKERNLKYVSQKGSTIKIFRLCPQNTSITLLPKE